MTGHPYRPDFVESPELQRIAALEQENRDLRCLLDYFRRENGHLVGRIERFREAVVGAERELEGKLDVRVMIRIGAVIMVTISFCEMLRIYPW